MNRETATSRCVYCSDPIYTAEWPLDELTKWRHSNTGRPECAWPPRAEPNPKYTEVLA